MKNVFDLITKVAKEEKKVCGSTFIAPRVKGGRLRILVSGMVKTLNVDPKEFEGWGSFEIDGKKARLVEEAMEYEKEDYLNHLLQMRFRLCFSNEDPTAWIAYPANKSVAIKKTGVCEPVVIRLVDGGSRFETVKARFDGAFWWFEGIDTNADPAMAEILNSEISKRTSADAINIKGLTPEDREAYDIAKNPLSMPGVTKPMTDEDRIRDYLERAGGSLESYIDRGDRWVVQWVTGSGERHSSAISKEHMTVLTAGICLSGGDNAFDLMSLVGVVEKRYNNDYDDDDW